MRQFLLISASALLLAFGACKAPEVPEGTPACVRDLIRDISNEDVRSPAATVWRYDYPEGVFYYVPPYCCDMFGLLYNDECKVICAPDGGFSGAGDGNCPELDQSKRKITLVWQDPR
ncbi:MAG: hypothetical protein EAZ89_17195 [Bacteroidetes bacterium]|jgi:hypothetical protein|nr:MAG: hypothetical protein EAZ89_17195 [Bacteroidota bacterium]